MRLYTGLRIVIVILLLSWFSPELNAQNYRDQRRLIRLRPGKVMLFGKISDYTGQKLSAATITIYNPRNSAIIESIPVDDLGEYLFTVDKGSYIGLLVEKESYFPYYQELSIPADAQKEIENNLHLPDGIRKEFSLIYAPDARMPANTDLLEELISLLISQTGLSLWIPGQENQSGKSRLEFLDSLFQSRGIEKYRLISGSIPGNTDQIVQLNFITDKDAHEPSADVFGDLTQAKDEDMRWTLQFTASRQKLSDRSLKGLKDTRVFIGSDGYYRYTYGSFATRKEANQAISYLQSKGFSQAFPKKIGQLKKL